MKYCTVKILYRNIIFSIFVLSMFSSVDVFAQKRVVLTFDDGPHPGVTERILDILDENDVPATFFLVGIMVNRFPGLVRKIHSRGYDLGNHTYSDIRLTSLENSEIERSISSVSDLLEYITGDRVQYFRPPGGRFNPDVVQIARRNGLHTVLWTRHVSDANSNTTAEKIYTLATKDPKEVELIMLHDGPEATIQALPKIIEFYRSSGYKFERLSRYTAPVFKSFAEAEKYEFSLPEEPDLDLTSPYIPLQNETPVNMAYLLFLASLGGTVYYIRVRGLKKKIPVIALVVVGADKKNIDIFLETFKKYDISSTFFLTESELENIIGFSEEKTTLHNYAYSASSATDAMIDAYKWQEILKDKRLTSIPFYYNKFGYAAEDIKYIKDSGFIPVDWKINIGENKKKILKYVNKKIKPFTVIPLSGDSLSTSDILPEILKKIDSKGYKVIALTDLLDMRYN